MNKFHCALVGQQRSTNTSCRCVNMVYAHWQKVFMKKVFEFPKPVFRKTARCGKNCVKSRCLTVTSESKNRSLIIFFTLKKNTKTASHITNLQVDTKIIRNLQSYPSLQEYLKLPKEFKKLCLKINHFE